MLEKQAFDGIRVQIGGEKPYTVYIPTTTSVQLFFDFYESTEDACLPLIYEPGDRVLDSGAGIGFITSHIAALADSVLGVEALPAYLATARLNTQNCANVALLEGALGLDDKRVTFYERQLAYASSKLDNTIAHDPIAQEFEAIGLNINDLIAGFDINALHLDLEGSEVELLEGTDLARINKVSLETHQYIYGKNGTARIMAALFRGGLIPYLVNRPNVSLDDRDTFAMSWMRPEIVARKQEQFKNFSHRTIRFADLELQLLPRKLGE